MIQSLGGQSYLQCQTCLPAMFANVNNGSSRSYLQLVMSTSCSGTPLQYQHFQHHLFHATSSCHEDCHLNLCNGGDEVFSGSINPTVSYVCDSID